MDFCRLTEDAGEYEDANQFQCHGIAAAANAEKKKRNPQ